MAVIFMNDQRTPVRYTSLVSHFRHSSNFELELPVVQCNGSPCTDYEKKTIEVTPAKSVTIS